VALAVPRVSASLNGGERQTERKDKNTEDSNQATEDLRINIEIRNANFETNSNYKREE